MTKGSKISEKRILRYSESFKQKVVQEIEEGKLNAYQAAKRYNIKGCSTISKWIKKMGKNHLLNKIVRIETMDEIDQLKTQQKQISELKEAIVQLELERLRTESYLVLACKSLGVDTETFKKKVSSRTNTKC
jgi:transposase